MIEEFVIRKLSKLFGVLSNDIRIKIIYKLMENDAMSISDLSNELKIPQNTLSAHLKILNEGGYLKKGQQWRNVLYSIQEPKLKEILEIGSLILYNKWEGNWEKIADAKNKIQNMKTKQGDK